MIERPFLIPAMLSDDFIDMLRYTVCKFGVALMIVCRSFPYPPKSLSCLTARPRVGFCLMSIATVWACTGVRREIDSYRRGDPTRSQRLETRRRLWAAPGPATFFASARGL